MSAQSYEIYLRLLDSEYRVTKKRISYLQAAMHYFFYYINDTNDEVLKNFPKIFEDF